jgi:SAM-dependent methyltransferase
MIKETICDNVDWAEVWKARMAASQQLRQGAECAGLWASRQAAMRYDSGVNKNGRARARAILGRMGLSRGQNVLDIGAGPGTHTIPLSKIVSRVTAVEPSEGMAETLAANLAKEGIANVRLIRKKWEDVSPDELARPYDVVLASLSLGMPDIRAALEKMDKACIGKVYLIWPVGVTAWERYYGEAWPVIHGELYVPGPKAEVLFNVLCQMGICPDVHVYIEDYLENFASLDEAVGYYRPMYCATAPDKENALRKYLGRKLNRSPGGLSLRGISTMALIGWDVMVNRIPV